MPALTWSEGQEAKPTKEREGETFRGSVRGLDLRTKATPLLTEGRSGIRRGQMARADKFFLHTDWAAR